MKTRILHAVLLTACCLLYNGFYAFSQLPSHNWTRTFGGTAVDIPLTIRATADGGTIVCGYTTSKDEDVINEATREYWDVWITKLDACGNVQWQQSFGGKGYESARDILQTSDGGYLVLAETNSVDGGVVAGYGGTKDIWLLKLTEQGAIQWQKRIGGSGLDVGNQLYAMEDGSFLIAATTSSHDGDVAGNHSNPGYTDAWLVKIDAVGNITWSRCFGGSKNEELLDIEISGSKIFVAGYANSTDGDIPSHQKNYDVWLLSTDMSGNKLTSRIYGGSQNDVAYSMSKGADGTLTLAGYTTSSDGDVSVNKGSQDYWILNVRENGAMNWQKTFGGSDADYANYILTDADGGFIVGGISYSPDGDVANSSGSGEFWLVKVDGAGNTLWTDVIGGSGNDYLRSMLFVPSRREYYIAGDSESDDGDFDENKGLSDFAILKYKMIDSLIRDTTVCDVAGFNVAPRLIQDQCGYDSLVVSYQPRPVASPFAGLTSRDTIFEGQSLTLPAAAEGTITWNPHPTLSCSSCRNPVANPSETMTYSARMDLGQCSTTGQFTLVVLKDAYIRMPNAFSPNGDGRNDLFGPAGRVPEDYRLQVFNRSGEIVFISTSMNARWDGRYKGRLQETNTFVYVVTYRDLAKQLQVLKGTVTLVR